MANIYANYLQKVTKHTLGMNLALVSTCRGLPTSVRLLVHIPSTAFLNSLCNLGVLRRHRVPLVTYQHTKTGVNSRSTNNNRHTGTGVNSKSSPKSRSKNNNSKVGRADLAKSNTYLRLTQDRPGQSLTKKEEEEEVFLYPSVPKLPMGTPCVGGWGLTVGGWRLMAVDGGWRQLVVGDWWLMAVGSGWRLAVGGPLGWSLRAVLNKKKNLGPK